METPPSVHARNFLYGRDGRVDSRMASGDQDFHHLRSQMKLNSKYLQKKQLFPSASKQETAKKILDDLRKHQTINIENTNWMFENGQTSQFLSNFSINSL